MQNFWQKMKKPLFVLAPMANVTDSAFRAMFAKYGKPDVTWTEFVSADGLCSPKGKQMLMRDLAFTPKERPIVAQLFTGHPEAMKKAAKMVAKLGFDGIDINMGCPDRSVEKQGGGAAMIKDPKSALAVLEAARQGGIPVTIKTRIGYNAVDWKWLRLLLEQNLPVLTVHLRTRKEMSDVPAHWELMSEIVKLRDEVQKEVAPENRTLIIGNGDVHSLVDGDKKIREFGCDGVMIGRGIFGKPWFFNRMVKDKTPEERLKIMLEHAKLFAKTFNGKKKGSHKNFAVMKKHFKAYVSGWDGAKELRVQLMEVENVKQVEKIVKEYLAANF
ncbi:MAG TPA: tRNA-dihydrouridine synthase [Candidatus Paceibacterota bacterium]|jgi:nifR3 family TIM-barrel protein|nr:tRNA-dihydrouridine synthase [Candidatus Paceibacterota bacterium]